MKTFLLFLTLSAALTAAAQTTPRGEAKQARADRKMERAHTIKNGESMTKEPKVMRKEDKHDDHRADTPKRERKFKM